MKPISSRSAMKMQPTGEIPPDDMKMAVYTYYFSRNIKALEFIDEDKKSDFTETLITNIKTVLSEIDSFIACHSIELSSKKGGGKNAKRH